VVKPAIPVQDVFAFDQLGDVDVEPLTLPRRRRRVVPAEPKKAGRPKRQSGPESFGTGALPPTRDADAPIWAVYDELRRLDPSGARTAYAIRESFDQAYDGQRTGRWDYSQLMKTEKTHIGTLIEIWLQREFLFDDGAELDYCIAGEDVDAKWSRNLYEWEIPLEMYSRGDKLAMVVWANEYTVRWALGLIRISEDVLLPPGQQRDKKRRLNERGKDRIVWVHRDKSLIKNTLLHLPSDLIDRISKARSGQAAVATLFREFQGELINRAAVLTAGQQVDAQKRVRDARIALAPEGIVIFGHYAPHPSMAEALGLPRPTLGRFVSARLARWQPGDDEPSITLEGESWRLSRDEELLGAAPALHAQGRKQ